MDETELINASQHGDLEAFNHLVLTYQEQVYNVALRMLLDEDQAEDATQESFLAAYRSIGGFRGGSLRAWLLRIVTNRCYDELRRQKRKSQQPLQSLENEDGEEQDDPPYLRDEHELPEDALARKQLEQAVQHCIEDLPGEYRSAVVLVDIQGLDYQEASQIIKKPIGTLKSRLARARLRLQDCLQGAWELLPAEYRLNQEGSQ